MDVRSLLPTTPARWLVTGAAGFIGSHLAQSLALAGQTVVAVDDFSTGHRANVESILASVSAAGRSTLTFREGDVGDPSFARSVTSGIDHVLHQAAIGSVPRSIAQPMVSYRANATGFVELLDAAREAGVASFVYASSSAVYGDHPKLPKTEDETGNPLSPYAATKAADELFARTWSRCYGMRTAGLRYFNVFGARQDPVGAYAAVIPAWIDALLGDRPVWINGDGLSSRDFCFVDNVVQANLRAALAFAARPAGASDVFNIAAGRQTTLLELFELLRAMLAVDAPSAATAQPRFRDFRPGDVRHSLADISRAGAAFGYRPTHTLAEGLREALPWYLGAGR